MVTPRRNRYLGAQLSMLVMVAISLVLIGAFSYDRFFFVALIGFMAITEFTAPFTVAPTWRRGLKWLIAAGLLIFGTIVGLRTVQLIIETM